MQSNEELFKDLDPADCNYQANRYRRAIEFVDKELGSCYPYDECPCLLEAAKELLKVCREYERCITWDTTCKNCSNLMDKLYDTDCELDKAKQEINELKREIALLS